MDPVKKINLGKHVEILSSKRIFKSDYVGEGIPFYRSKEIIEKSQNKEISIRLFISRDKFQRISKEYGVPTKGDLLISSVGARSGIPYIVKDELPFYFKDGNLIWFRNFDSELNSIYLCYYFNSHLGQGNLKSIMIGAAQPALTISGIKSLNLDVPNIKTQQKTATILSNYDTLIENNEKRIKLLENMAKLIYEEWFIKLRFPGHEKVKMINSGIEFGEIPNGWEVRKIEDLLERIKNKYNEEIHRNLPLLDLSRIPKRSFLLTDYTNSDFLTTSRFIFDEDNILFGSIRPYFHKVVFTHGSGISNSSVFILKPKKKIYFIYSLMNLFDEKTIKWATTNSQGTKMPVIDWKVLEKKEILLPPDSILEKYNRVAIPFINMIKKLSFKNQNLRKTRNLLLPKLISGKIDVSELEIQNPKLS